MEDLIKLAKRDLMFYKDKNKKLKQTKAEHLTIIQLLDYQIAENEEEIIDISEGIKMLKDVDDTGCKDLSGNDIKVGSVLNNETLEVVQPTVVRTSEHFPKTNNDEESKEFPSSITEHKIRINQLEYQVSQLNALVESQKSLMEDKDKEIKRLNDWIENVKSFK